MASGQPAAGGTGAADAAEAADTEGAEGEGEVGVEGDSSGAGRGSVEAPGAAEEVEVTRGLAMVT